MGLKEIWKDPVWSKVIASIILLVSGFLVPMLFPDWRAGIETGIEYEIAIPVWMLGIIPAFIVLIFLALKLRKGSRNEVAVSSGQWFSEIDRQIKDCNFARIYLREFAHPDQFRSEHRESLLSFMNSLAERLKAGADIEVVAYHASEAEKSGLDWLKSELQQNIEALNQVKLISIQPVSNSSSMYLFDSGLVIYNRRLNDDYSYHIEDLHGSIVHYLIKCGFKVSKDELL